MMMKILLVDDDEIILEAISGTLKKEGYEVISVSDGFQALDKVETEDFDMVISDIMMPNLSGLTLLTLLKRHYKNDVPVLLISSLDKVEIILSALGMGADDFILKPLNFLELVIRVKKLITASQVINN
jgi:two-component system, OmpR family, response regulator VicR